MSGGQDWANEVAQASGVVSEQAKPRRPKVYLSGPCTLGDRDGNYYQSVALHRLLIRHGMAVFNPILTIRMPGAWEIPHETWMENDLPWVECADAVLRLPGESVGADAECRHAMECEIPVFNDYEDLLHYFQVSDD
jgi:hypothetical protein